MISLGSDGLCSPLPWVAGIDEVGRGALFGPVVAAAVILPPEQCSVLQSAGVIDSKQLSASQREQLAALIQSVAIDCRIGVASAQEIDRLNILWASLLAMQRAVARLTPQPQHCLIDGNYSIPNLTIPQQPIVKGDEHCLEIAAASIVAKVWRDRLLTRLAHRYPGYGLDRNKGYGTQQHRTALQQLGLSKHHRRSFKPCHLPNLENVETIEMMVVPSMDHTLEAQPTVGNPAGVDASTAV